MRRKGEVETEAFWENASQETCNVHGESLNSSAVNITNTNYIKISDGRQD